MSAKRTSVTKRACDGCKIRKIRCGGGNPCPACTNARIKCTYIRVQQPRGPQRLRSTTKYLIDQAQRGGGTPSAPLESVTAEDASPLKQPDHSVQAMDGSRIPINILASPLYIYHVRMYPVWPIVDVENVIARLKQDPHEENTQEIYALATAVAAATIAQLRLGQNACAGAAEKSVTADNFVAESLRARNSSGYRTKANLNNVRTSFFLHVYYENQCSGGTESLLYLREAISLAQMMQLHRESSYACLPLEEQQIRRRVLWLLFVTERGVCILHKLPTVLRTNISTPDLDINDEPQVLPAFLKLLTLFRLFEQSKMFDLIEDDEPAALPEQSHSIHGHSLDRRFLQLLQDNLQDGSSLLDHISDVQKADLCVTRHWMRMILWRFSAKTSPSFPVMVARDLLSIVSQLPRTAIEAHGLGMELKLYEIANSLADAVMNLALVPSAPPSSLDGEPRPSSILARLHSILSTFRGGGGNQELAEILYKKMAEAQVRSGPTLCPSIKSAANKSRRKLSTGENPTGVQQGVGDVHAHSRSEMWSDTGLSADSTFPDPPSGDDVRDYIAEDGWGLRTDDLCAFDDSLAGQLWQDPSLHQFGSMFDAYMPTTSVEGMDGRTSASPGLAGFSPALPSNSMDMLIGDFISQIPGETFFENDYIPPTSYV